MSVPSILPEFHIPKISDEGLAHCEEVAMILSDALSNLVRIGVTGRGLALVTTKLQEAYAFALLSVITQPGNHE